MYEFEARFYGIYKSDLFIEFLKDLFKDRFIENVKDTSYIFDESIRYIVNSDGNISKIKKKELESRKESYYKYSVSEEINLEVESTISSVELSKSNTIRSRSRDIYNFESNIELHITHINGKEYEVELELESNNLDDSNKFSDSFGKFRDFISPHVFNLKYFLKVFNDYPKDSLKNNITYMDRSVIDRPRDIHKKDFITVKDKSTGKIKGIPEGYTLTVKGNGVPILLFQNKNNLYMISPAGKFFKLVNENRSNKFTESYIIIGEYFEENTTFSPFDIIYHSRESNIRYHLNHLERMNITKDIILRNKSIFDGVFDIFFKNFVKTGDTPETFAAAYLKVKKYALEYPFGNDGLILTPIFTPHNSGEYRKGDTLSKKPSTCKIKPWHELTIDFRVDVKTEEVFTSVDSSSYKGTDKHIFNSKINVEWNTIPEKLDEKILEFRPEKRDNGSIVFVYSRQREDKIAPNNKKVADDIWDLIYENIPDNFFKAKDFSRLRQQNNKVKKDLISSIPKKSIVIDIGFGAGGDIDKYNGIAEIVIGVEPDESRRKILYKRLEESKSRLTTRFLIVESGGEDVEKIMEVFIPVRKSYPNAHVAVVSMLSLTFFWKNRTMLDKLEKTLTTISKESSNISGSMNEVSKSLPTYFYFYTIEGNRFLKYFKENNNKIINYGMKAKYSPESSHYGVGIPGKVQIKILDSVTVSETQTEYLVVLEDLKCLKNLEYNSGIVESYLTKEEHDYGMTHVFGKSKIDFTEE